MMKLLLVLSLLVSMNLFAQSGETPDPNCDQINAGARNEEQVELAPKVGEEVKGAKANEIGMPVNIDKDE